MMRNKIQLETAGDDKRIIKHADIDLFEITDGLLARLLPRSLKSIRYEAVHRPTGLASRNLWFTTMRPEFAVSDCIWRAGNLLFYGKPDIEEGDTPKLTPWDLPR